MRVFFPPPSKILLSASALEWPHLAMWIECPDLKTGEVACRGTDPTASSHLGFVVDKKVRGVVGA